MSTNTRSDTWTWLIPALSTALLVGAAVMGVGPLIAVLCGIGVIGAVFAAVYHAEVVAHRVGEPFGTLILAVAVTVIEVSLILSLMFAGGEGKAVLPRDTIYAAVMIICNGVVGVCILVGGIAHREQTFRVEGAGAGLAALIAMSALSLVLPAFTTTTAGGTSTGRCGFGRGETGSFWAPAETATASEATSAIKARCLGMIIGRFNLFIKEVIHP